MGEYPTNVKVNMAYNDDAVTHDQGTYNLMTDEEEFPGQQVLRGNLTIPYIYERISVNVTLSNIAGVFPQSYKNFHFCKKCAYQICQNNMYIYIDYLTAVENIIAARISCNLVNVTWTMSEVMVGTFYYNLHVYQDDSVLLVDENITEVKNYLFQNEQLFQHYYTYRVTVVNELNKKMSVNESFLYNIRGNKLNYSRCISSFVIFHSSKISKRI